MVKVTDNFNFLFNETQDQKIDVEQWENLKENISELENRIRNSDLEYLYNLNIYKSLYYPFINYLIDESFLSENEIKPNWELKDLLSFINENYRNQFDPQIIYFLQSIKLKRNDEAHRNYSKGLSEIISSLKYFWYVLYYFKFKQHPKKDFDESKYYKNVQPNNINVLEKNNSPKDNIISTKEIEISKDKLLNWLVEDKTINIPVYQRAYTWNTNNCKNLYEDIKLKLNDDGVHYFGVIAAKTQDDKIKIIDGQQRLITSILFCCAIRKVIKQIDHESYTKSTVYDVLNRKNALSYYFENPTGKSESNKCLEFILNDELDRLTDSHKKTQIFTNFDFFAKKLTKDLETRNTIGEKIEFLNFMSIVFLKKFVLATISFDELTNPKKELMIFENINSKGKTLDFIDFCKNYLFMLCEDEELIRNDGVDLINEYSSIFSSDDKKENEQFFELLMNYETGKEVPVILGIKLELFKETIVSILQSINIDISKKLNLEEFRRLAEKLRTFYSYFNSLRQNYYNNNNFYEINGLSVFIKYIKARSDRLWFTSILFFINDYVFENNLLDNKNMMSIKSRNNIKNLLLFCLKCYLKVKIVSRKGDSTLKRFFIFLSSYLRKNFLDKEIISLESDEVKKLLKALPKDEELEMSLIQPMDKDDVKKLFLFVIENNLTNGFFDGEFIELNNRELEHILPETIKNHLIPNSYRDNYDYTSGKSIEESFEQEAKEFNNKIGNWILISKKINSQMGDKQLKSKWELMKQSNASSPLIHNEEFGLKKYVDSDWDFQAINDRTKKIANYCMTKIFNE